MPLTTDGVFVAAPQPEPIPVGPKLGEMRLDVRGRHAFIEIDEVADDGSPHGKVVRKHTFTVSPDEFTAFVASWAQTGAVKKLFNWIIDNRPEAAARFAKSA